MAYVPRGRSNRIQWKIVLPIAIFVVALFTFGIVKLLKDEGMVNQKYTVCELDEEQTLKALNKQFKNVITVSDYLYYGESLDLYEKKYSPENKDTLSGKTLQLKNICDQSEISMTMENTIDQKILLDELPAGFYEVYIIDNLVEKRVAFDRTLEDNEFFTAKRNNKVREVTLVANTNLLQEYGITLDKNYLFLEVKDVKPNPDDIDVLIDPFGMNMDLTWLPDEGSKYNGLNENEEMFKAAQLLKKELESYGLRVKITKDSKDESGKAYGEDGRIAQGYKHNAKYYLFLRFNNFLDGDIRGFEVHHSYYASKILARNLTYGVSENLNVPLSPMYRGTDPGIVTDYLALGKDNKQIYDANLYIRESGGRATMTARYSDASAEANAAFKDANGMMALQINFGYISNKEDAAYWKGHKEELIKQIAKSFVEGINVEKASE